MSREPLQDIIEIWGNRGNVGGLHAFPGQNWVTPPMAPSHTAADLHRIQLALIKQD